MKPAIPSPCIVDTNVALVANGSSTAGIACRNACTKALTQIVASGHVVIDDGWRILKEYSNRLSPSGQPGPGDAFLKWLLSNHRNVSRCTQVHITQASSDPTDFVEFPQAPGLSEFDRSDRKFVAVAAAHPAHPPILEAFDSKWWGWAPALRAAGLEVLFLCPEVIEAKYDEKMRPKSST
jgi:hypothetical protein